ncbi:MAG: chemotaxis protein CheW [Candidatus Melainabacteria bacterium]
MATRSFATFLLNEQLFGIEILLVREINRQLEMSIVPHAPAFVRGLINLRGQIVTVLDLNHKLGLGDLELTHRTHNIILKTEQELDGVRQREQRSDLYSCEDKIGLLVEDIQDVITVEQGEIEPPPANVGQIDGKYLSGVVKLDNKLVSIISIEKVLEAAENN